MTKDINSPRLPTLRDKLRAMRTPITVWNYMDLSEVADPNYFGFNGSPTRVIKVYTPTAEGRKGQRISGSPEEVAQKNPTDSCGEQDFSVGERGRSMSG